MNDWNAAYKRGVDYKVLSTMSLKHILSMSNAVSKGRVLDIGCGTGQLVRDLFHLGYEVTGIDLSDEAIALAKDSTIYSGKGIDFIVGDATTTDKISGTFDFIISKYVVAFIEVKQAFFEKVKSLMSPGAVFVILTPSPELLPEDKKHISVDPLELEAMLKNTFSEVTHESIAGDDYFYARP